MARQALTIEDREACDYDTLGRELASRKQRLAPGETLTVICSEPVRAFAEPALRDWLPPSHRRREHEDGFDYVHDAPAFGAWRTAAPTGDTLVFIPFINRADLLAKALESLPVQLPVLVLDQTREGLVLPQRTSHYQVQRASEFAELTNWAFSFALTRSIRWLCYMHTDAECRGDAAYQALDDARRSGAAITWTNGDAFAVYDMVQLAQVGMWDETFACYVGDLDYHHRLRRQGRQIAQSTAPVLHHVSQTLRSFERRSERQRILALQTEATAQLALKWGDVEGGDTTAAPYRGQGFERAPQAELFAFVRDNDRAEAVPLEQLQRHVSMVVAPLSETRSEVLRLAREKYEDAANAYAASACARCPLTATLGAPPAVGAADFDRYRRRFALHHLQQRSASRCWLSRCAVTAAVSSRDVYLAAAQATVLPVIAASVPGCCDFLSDSGCGFLTATQPEPCTRPECPQASALASEAALARLQDAAEELHRRQREAAVYAADADAALPFGLRTPVGRSLA